MQPTPWLICPPGGPRRLRLYCFPYSGGNAVSFVPWQRAIDPAIELCAIQLPGRGARFREQPYTSFRALIQALAEMLKTQHASNAGPFAFFGHSLGALVAFELARHCQHYKMPLPVHLFASGCNAPPFRDKSKRFHELEDNALIDALRDFNGTPQEVLENRDLMRILLPAIRADFALGADYHYEPGEPLALPLTVLSGRNDKHVHEEELKGWEKETSAAYRIRWFDGDHFFINDERQAVLDCIAAGVGEYCRG